jgi:hypothetical protein
LDAGAAAAVTAKVGGRLGDIRQVGDSGGAERNHSWRIQLPDQSTASGFRKNQDRSSDGLSVRFAPFCVKWNSSGGESVWNEVGASSSTVALAVEIFQCAQRTAGTAVPTISRHER